MIRRETMRIKVHGLVQGVGYRYSMVAEAERLGITGWVRNCADGSVEAIIQGTPEQLKEIVAWARKGPPSAQITKIDVSIGEGDFDDFTISNSSF